MVKEPRVTIDREPKELPEKLEFLPDSREQIERSMPDGIRPQLEKVFKAAIERAQKGKGK